MPSIINYVIVSFTCISIEEGLKRAQEETDGSYQAVGFTYQDKPQQESETIAPVTPAPQQHPPTSSVDVLRGKEEAFLVPEGLNLPADIKLVCGAYYD